jgi:hypothetical protein
MVEMKLINETTTKSDISREMSGFSPNLFWGFKVYGLGVGVYDVGFLIRV